MVLDLQGDGGRSMRKPDLQRLAFNRRRGESDSCRSCYAPGFTTHPLKSYLKGGPSGLAAGPVVGGKRSKTGAVWSMSYGDLVILCPQPHLRRRVLFTF